MSAVEHSETLSTVESPAITSVPHSRKTRTWPRPAFPILILSLLAAGMVGQLALQTRIQEQGFQLGALQAEAERLDARQVMLQAALDKKSTPQQLAYAASQLGMVANPYSTFLTLPTGEITGTNSVVVGDEVPVISAPPSLTVPSPADDVVAQASQPTDTPAQSQEGGTA